MPEKPDRPGDLSGAEKLVAQGATVMRFENDQMAAFALAHPRNEAEIKERALANLSADPDAAASAYYSIPYKEHTRAEGCTGQSDDPCPIKEEVEGIGIEGARELARLWRNNASRVYVTDEDDEWVWLSGVFTDLETNTRTEVPLGVSKFGTRRGGGVYTLNPQRLAMAVSAGVSKVARNAIVQALPRHLSRAYYERAKEIIAGSGAVDIPKLVEAFAAYGVTRERLEGFFGAKLEELEGDDRRKLRGLFVAIRERLVEPERFFSEAGGSGSTSDGPATGPQSKSRAGGVNGSPVSGSTAEVRGGTQAKTEAEWQGEAEDARAAAHGSAEPSPAPGDRASAESAPAAAPGSEGTSDPAETPGSAAPEPAPGGPPNEEVSKGGETRPKAEPETEGGSQPTPDGVGSSTPNEEREPSQASLEDLGI